MSKGLLAVTAVALGLCVLAVPVAAQSPPSQGDCTPAPAVFATDLLALPLLAAPMAGGGGALDGPAEQSVCNALCSDGSYVTCWGASCTADDASCPAERGQCWGSDTGTRYCPPCDEPPPETCSASAQCADGSFVSCEGFSECYAFDHCYAYCDGNYNWCSELPPEIICPL